MIRSCLFAFLLVLVPQDDAILRARRLIEQLRSDHIEQRNKAAWELEGLVDQARPEIEKAAQDSDLEVRSTAQRLLDDSARRKRIACVRPMPRHLTLSLKEVPLASALEQVSNPLGFGRNAFRIDVPAELQAKISLDLRDANPWQALDALANAARSEWTPGVERWYLSPEGSEQKESWTKCDGFGIRIWGQMGWYSRENEPPVPRLLIRVHLPPDSHPLSWSVEDVEVTDNSGRLIKIDEGIPLTGAAFSRKPGCVGHFEALRHTLPRGSVTELGLVNVKGKLNLMYPRDVNRDEIDLRDFAGPWSKKFNGVTFRIAAVRILKDRSELDYEVSKDKGAPMERFLAWIEDRGNRRVADWLVDAEGKGTPSKLEDRDFNRCVLLHVKGEESVRIPFQLKGIVLSKSR